jgi:hypothetical protein
MKLLHLPFCTLSGQCCGSGSGIRCFFSLIPDLGSPTHISESIVTIFGLKLLKFFVKWLKLFCTFFNFVKFMATQGMTTNLLALLFFVVVRSGIVENEDPG